MAGASLPESSERARGPKRPFREMEVKLGLYWECRSHRKSVCQGELHTGREKCAAGGKARRVEPSSSTRDVEMWSYTLWGSQCGVLNIISSVCPILLLEWQ